MARCWKPEYRIQLRPRKEPLHRTTKGTKRKTKTSHRNSQKSVNDKKKNVYKPPDNDLFVFEKSTDGNEIGFDVEFILFFITVPPTKNNLNTEHQDLFLVKWKGYDELTWEPTESVKLLTEKVKVCKDFQRAFTQWLAMFDDLAERSNRLKRELKWILDTFRDFDFSKILADCGFFVEGAAQLKNYLLHVKNLFLSSNADGLECILDKKYNMVFFFVLKHVLIQLTTRTPTILRTLSIQITRASLLLKAVFMSNQIWIEHNESLQKKMQLLGSGFTKYQIESVLNYWGIN